MQPLSPPPATFRRNAVRNEGVKVGLGRKEVKGRFFSGCLCFSPFNSPVEEGESQSGSVVALQPTNVNSPQLVLRDNHSNITKVALITEIHIFTNTWTFIAVRGGWGRSNFRKQYFCLIKDLILILLSLSWTFQLSVLGLEGTKGSGVVKEMI